MVRCAANRQGNVTWGVAWCLEIGHFEYSSGSAADNIIRNLLCFKTESFIVLPHHDFYVVCLWCNTTAAVLVICGSAVECQTGDRMITGFILARCTAR